jgi:hypothetical protein
LRTSDVVVRSDIERYVNAPVKEWDNDVRFSFLTTKNQWCSKGMANCTYARWANCKGVPNCAKVAFSSYNQIDIFSLYSLKYVDVVYLYTLRMNLMKKLWK